MKILAINPISFKKRMIELLFDYPFILAYLALLFLGSMLFYIIFFNGIPEFTEIQSQFANHSTFYILRLYKKWEFWEGESRTSIGL